MAKCKNCSSQVEDNATVCAVCGQINPIKSKKVKTVDLTTKFEHDIINRGNYKQSSRKVAVLLFFLLGFTGAAYFYLKDIYRGFISLLGTIVIMGAALLLYGFVFKNEIIIIIIAALIIFAVNIVVGVYYLTHNELKDGQGEFLV